MSRKDRDSRERSDVALPIRLLAVPEGWDGSKELEERILSRESLHLERIVSRGHTAPEEGWYDQDHDEWVALLQGRAVIRFDDGRVLVMEAGDAYLIPAHDRHKVDRTSSDPPCVWIALHLPAAGSGL